MKYFVLIVAQLFSISTYAQPLSGYIFSANTQAPIEAASIFIDGTSMGTFSNKDGKFSIGGKLRYPLTLVVQMLSYKTKSVHIRDAQELHKIYLQEKAEELAEYTVLAPIKDGWQIYGAEFLDNFIGISDFAQQCTIKNKEAVQFKYDREKATLYVSALEPLIIENFALGYTIYYDLQSFSRQFSTGVVYYSGYSRFEAKNPKNAKQQKKWEENRRSAYKGSLLHFLRAAYHQKTEADSFKLNVVERGIVADYGSKIPIWTDTFDWQDTLDIKYLNKLVASSACDFKFDSLKWNVILKEINEVMVQSNTLIATTYRAPLKLSDSNNTHSILIRSVLDIGLKRITKFKLSYYDSARKPPTITDLGGATITGGRQSDEEHIRAMNAAAQKRMQQRPFDYLYTAALPIDSFCKEAELGAKELFCQNMIQVIYLPEVEEQAYRKATYKSSNLLQKASPQTSLLVFKNKKPIRLFANGYYADYLDLFIEGYWSYEKVDKMLPLEYE